MVFISDPYFNEPAYEGMRGTSEGSASSLKYNSGGRVQGWGERGGSRLDYGCAGWRDGGCEGAHEGLPCNDACNRVAKTAERAVSCIPMQRSG